MEKVSREEYRKATRAGGYRHHARHIINEFVEKGYDCAQLSPVDFGLDMFSRNQVLHACSILRDEITKRKLNIKVHMKNDKLYIGLED